MKRLKNKMVVPLAEGFTSQRYKPTITIYSEKRPTQDVHDALRGICMIKSVVILDTILKKYFVKNFYIRYIHMGHKRTTIMIAIQISI